MTSSRERLHRLYDHEEMVAPPLHGRQDFIDFNVRYDRAIADRIHAAGGRLNVHCHGSVKSIIDCFPELGADCLVQYQAMVETVTRCF